MIERRQQATVRRSYVLLLLWPLPLVLRATGVISPDVTAVLILLILAMTGLNFLLGRRGPQR